MTIFKMMLIGSLFCFGSAQAEIYKCVVRGMTTFSQKPCSVTAEKVDVKTYNPTQEEQQQAAANSEFHKQYSEDADRQGQLNYLYKQNTKIQEEIDMYQSRMDVEMALLKRQKNRSANNLAGATWEESLSSEMMAVTNKYEIKIQQANLKLTRNEAKIDQLTK